MSIENINWLAVIVAALAFFVLGAVWYMVFSTPFLKYRLYGGMTEQDLQGRPTDYLGTAVADVIAAVMLAALINATGTTTLLDGVWLGFLVALGFVATTTFVFSIFDLPNLGLWVIHVGYQFVGFCIMGGILGAWR
jgi:hypothetical protein